MDSIAGPAVSAIRYLISASCSLLSAICSIINPPEYVTLAAYLRVEGGGRGER